MKAKVIRQKVYDGVMDFIHDGGHYINRLVVEEANNLAITPHENEVYAFTGFDLKDEHEMLSEVEVPDELVEKAVAFVRVKAEFDGLKDTFEALLG